MSCVVPPHSSAGGSRRGAPGLLAACLALTPLAAPGPVDVPATPSAEEARRAAQEELSKAVYQERPSLAQLIWDWLQEHLSPTHLVPGVPAWVSVVVTLVAALALLAGLVYVLRYLTWARRARLGSRRLFEDPRDAASLTRAADAAAGTGDWATAVVERFRAIIRSLDERGLIEDYPGMTAREAATLAARALRSLRQELLQAAALFDSVRYGHVQATRQQDEWIRQLAGQVASLRPTQTQKGQV